MSDILRVSFTVDLFIKIRLTFHTYKSDLSWIRGTFFNEIDFPL